jgi:hypothetical protein
MFAQVRTTHADRTKMTISNHVEPTAEGSSSRVRKSGVILTDSHFLIPLAVFCVGLALLITLH